MRNTKMVSLYKICNLENTKSVVGLYKSRCGLYKNISFQKACLFVPALAPYD